MCHNENYWDLKESKDQAIFSWTVVLFDLIENYLNFAILSATRATLTPQTSRLPDILTYARWRIK